MSIPGIPIHLQLQVVSADRSLINEQVDEVQVPGSERFDEQVGGVDADEPALARPAVALKHPHHRQGRRFIGGKDPVDAEPAVRFLEAA